MEPLKLGIIGCGVIATHAHLPDARRSPLIEVVAVADTVEEKARAASEKFGIPRFYTNAFQLIQDEEVEAVVLAMPTGVRTALALQVLAARKHLLLEKPVAMNAGEVRQLMEARGDRVVACCSSRFRMLSSARAAEETISSGALGELRVIRCRAVLAAQKAPVSPPPAWRTTRSLNGGGILVNWGCYDLDYLMGITGWRLQPRVVLAQAWPVAPLLLARVAPGSDAEAHFIALIRCEDGAVISFERAEFAAAATDEAWQILGSKGSLRLRMVPGKGQQILLDRADAELGVVTSTLWEGDEDSGGMNLEVLENFARAVREGAPVYTSLERALVLQQVTDAIYASAERGVGVVVDGQMVDGQ